jgi:hypothetical protein
VLLSYADGLQGLQLYSLFCPQEFVSHCAPDDPTDFQPTKMTCQQLRDHLRPLNLDTRGTKPQLIARLEAARGWISAGGDASPPAAAAAAAAAGGGSDTEVLVIGDSSGGDDSGDDLDRAEDALAQRLSGEVA